MFHMDEGTSANSELNGEDNEAGFSGMRSGAIAMLFRALNLSAAGTTNSPAATGTMF